MQTEYDEIISIKENDIIDKKISLYNNLVFFDIDEYLTNIYKSYNCNIEDITRQFEKDFYRHNIIFNNEKIKQIIVFKNKIGNLIKPIKFGKFNMSINNLIIMLMTQSSYYLPFLYLHKRITNNNVHIVNCDTDKTIKIETTDYYFSDNHITFDINMLLKAINIETEKTERIYNVSLNLNLNISKLKFDSLGLINIS